MLSAVMAKEVEDQLAINVVSLQLPPHSWFKLQCIPLLTSLPVLLQGRMVSLLADVTVVGEVQRWFSLDSVQASSNLILEWGETWFIYVQDLPEDVVRKGTSVHL